LVVRIHAEGLESAAGTEETSGVRCCVVGKASFNSVVSKFLAVSLSQNTITLHSWVDDLADHLTVGKTSREPILRSVILVFRSVSKELTSLVISFSFSASTETHLVPSEVAFGLYHLNKTHLLMNIWIEMEVIINV
jgi:hypothetical protein